MSVEQLVSTARLLAGNGRGLLAMDESNGTCNKRFAAAGIAQTAAARRAYRALLITTPDLASCVSGAILYDETIRQSSADGTPFAELLAKSGIVPGIKVDTGAKKLAGFSPEEVTEGLDGLRDRLAEYRAMGARFAKWRAVIVVGSNMPSRGCLDANAHALARYAALCQEAGLVPVVEPEVLMQGDHTMERCRLVTEETLACVFAQLRTQRVVLEAMILKPNMVLPGLACTVQEPVDTVAAVTVQTLLRVVPAAVAGIAFLSGGQSGELASARLSFMHVLARQAASPPPWPLTFSFARTIQMPALDIWHGEDANLHAAQAAVLHRARCNAAALKGAYTSAMECPIAPPPQATAQAA